MYPLIPTPSISSTFEKVSESCPARGSRRSPSPSSAFPEALRLGTAPTHGVNNNSDSVSLHQRTHDDSWWPMMIHDDSWWFMMIHGDLWRSMMIYDDLWWSMMIYDDLWWSMMIYDGLWWSMMIYIDESYCWFMLMIYIGDLWWFVILRKLWRYFDFQIAKKQALPVKVVDSSPVGDHRHGWISGTWHCGSITATVNHDEHKLEGQAASSSCPVGTFKDIQNMSGPDHLSCSNPLHSGCPGILHKDRGFAWIHPGMVSAFFQRLRDFMSLFASKFDLHQIQAETFHE